MERPAGAFFFSEKMTPLDFVDMHFEMFTDFDQYVVQISLHLSQIDEICFGGSNLSSP